MAIMAYILNSVLNFFVLISLLAVGTVNDPKFYVGCLLAIVAGFLLRVGIEINNNSLTRKSALIQAIYSTCLCYLSVLVWRDWDLGLKLEYYLFFCSCFSVFIVGLLEKTFKKGLSGYAEGFIKRVLAKDNKQEEN